jgi:CDP-diacylglycerol--serine O-phosphatidyltransferase
MLPRFVGRIGLADAVTVANAAVGFLATILAPENVEIAARLLLFAAIADGLDGVIARHYGSTEAGPVLDSLADVSSFAVAPAALVYTVLVDGWAVDTSLGEPKFLIALAVPALFVAMAVVRLGLYTAYDTDGSYTEGVPSTLAATIIGAAILAEVGLQQPELVLLVTLLFAYLMVTRIEYPDLLTGDALLMGVIHALAVLVPVTPLGRTFPVALLTLSLAYLVLSPWLYWRDGMPSIRANGNA